jgi:hypothetical protein
MQDVPAPSRINRRDISEKGINEEVHGFANGMTEPLNWPRRDTPYDYNGSGPRAHQGVIQRNSKDISEKGINEEVHGFANGMTEPLNWPRKNEPYDYNGSSPRAHQNVNTLYQSGKTDINNKEVRPDVYTVVKSMVNPTPLWRTNKAPKYIFEPWWGEDGAPPRTDLDYPPCPVDDGPDAEPDLATIKREKIMAEEKLKDEKRQAIEDAKEEKALKAAEEEQKKADDEAKAKAAAAANPGAAAEEKKEEGKTEEKKEEKKEEAKTEEKKEEKKEEAKPALANKPAANKSALAQQSQFKVRSPGKIVKLMTGDLIFDKANNLWRHEPVFIQEDEE